MENTQSFVFVYSKDEKIKVLNYQEAINQKQQMIKDNWIHTATIDACVFIQYLHNNCDPEDLHKEINDLRKPVKKNV